MVGIDGGMHSTERLLALLFETSEKKCNFWRAECDFIVKILYNDSYRFVSCTFVYSLA